MGENVMEKMHKEKSKFSDSNLKPDKTCHKSKEDLGTMAKNPSKLPGQMYVPKSPDHNESDFAGEMR